MLGAAVVLGIALVAVGLALPSADSPINVIGVLIAGFAEVMSPLPVDAWSAVYLVLLAAVVVPGGVAFCAAGNILGRFRV